MIWSYHVLVQSLEFGVHHNRLLSTES